MRLNELSREKLKSYKEKANSNLDKARFDKNKHQKLARHYDNSFWNLQSRHDSKRFASNNDYNASVRDINHQWHRVNKHEQGAQRAHATISKRKEGLKLVNKKLISTGNKSGLSDSKLSSYIPKAEKDSTSRFISASNRALRTNHHGTQFQRGPTNMEIKKEFEKSGSRDTFVQRAKNIISKRQKERLKKHFPDNIKEEILNEISTEKLKRYAEVAPKNMTHLEKKERIHHKGFSRHWDQAEKLQDKTYGWSTDVQKKMKRDKEEREYHERASRAHLKIHSKANDKRLRRKYWLGKAKDEIARRTATSGLSSKKLKDYVKNAPDSHQDLIYRHSRGTRNLGQGNLVDRASNLSNTFKGLKRVNKRKAYTDRARSILNRRTFGNHNEE